MMAVSQLQERKEWTCVLIETGFVRQPRKNILGWTCRSDFLDFQRVFDASLISRTHTGITLGTRNITENTTHNNYFPDDNADYENYSFLDYFTDYYDIFSTKHEEIISNIEIFKICICFVILVVGAIGNGLVIFVTSYKMKTPVNSIWFLNLSTADFIFILFLVHEIVASFPNTAWSLGNFMCKSLHLVMMLNMFASVFFLTVISLDRCLCTWLVVWAQNKRTLVKARIICVFVWILSICCSIPFAIVYSIKELNGFKMCIFSSPDNIIMSLTTYRFTVGFLIPFFIIAASNIAIGVRVKRFKRRKQLRSFQVIISVILAFFICWFPFHVQQLCYFSAVMNSWSDSVQEGIVAAGPFVKCLVYLNSCLNPILYVFMCEEYKKKLKKSLLLVLEMAFREENLGLQSTSHSQQVPRRQTDDTTTSFSAISQENKQVF